MANRDAILDDENKPTAVENRSCEGKWGDVLECDFSGYDENYFQTDSRDSPIPEAKTNEAENTDDDLSDYDENFQMDSHDLPIPAAKTNETENTDFSSFRGLGIKKEIIKSLNASGHEHPSEIQRECIPQALAYNDILAQAQSGTGKTLTFILTTLHLLEAKDNEIHTLVLCPTRELAYQIGKQYELFSKNLSDIRVATFFGGLPIEDDANILKNNCPHIVVGTVGRILSLIKSKTMNVDHLKNFVLDECDQMLQLSKTNFQIQEIFFNLPREKQVLMFSATLNQEMRKECKRFMRDPIEIYMDHKGGLRMKGLVQYYICMEENVKYKILVKLLDWIQYTQAIIFVRSVKRCRILENLLIKNNYSAIGIHRNMPQEERLNRYQIVKDVKKKILVATNVFGRGMDVGSINVVINLDMPGNPYSYVHAVARAGRFDTVGTAVTFITSEEDAVILNEVQTEFKMKIKKLKLNKSKSAKLST